MRMWHDTGAHYGQQQEIIVCSLYIIVVGVMQVRTFFSIF